MAGVNDQPRFRAWLRRQWREWDREFSVNRTLLLLVAVPTGVLLGGASAAFDAGEMWWPWLAGAVGWLLLSLAGSVAIWYVLFSGQPRRARRR